MNNDTPEEDLLKGKIIEHLKCDSCSQSFPDSKVLTFYGNVNVGRQGGIIGNNFKDGKVANVSVYCGDCSYRIMFLDTGIKSFAATIANSKKRS